MKQCGYRYHIVFASYDISTSQDPEWTRFRRLPEKKTTFFWYFLQLWLIRDCTTFIL